MLANALIFVAQVAFGLLTLALLLRFYLQWVRAPYRNPLADFVNALTDFMVRPARRVVPGGRHAGRIRRPDLRRRDHRQDAVDQESEERERQHDPEEARGGVGERMGGEGHGALHRQPRSRLMFSRFTVFLCRKIAMMIARPTAASAAATVITKITNTWPVAP